MKNKQSLISNENNKSIKRLVYAAILLLALVFLASKGLSATKNRLMAPTPTPTAPIQQKVTLIEGWRVEEMAERLNKDLGIKNEDFLKVAKEGHMFPDTYFFAPNASSSAVAQKLRDTFDLKYDNNFQGRIKKLGLTSAEGVILASLVEREARTDEPRRMVASILIKRLRIDMGLNVDSTIQYVLGYQPSEKSWWKRSITNNDKKINSPYNTYLYVGLPPTPICNPSLSSLEAVANADPSTPFLYYFHDSQGVSHYSRTLEEHDQQKANYL